MQSARLGFGMDGEHVAVGDRVVSNMKFHNPANAAARLLLKKHAPLRHDRGRHIISASRKISAVHSGLPSGMLIHPPSVCTVLTKVNGQSTINRIIFLAWGSPFHWHFHFQRKMQWRRLKRCPNKRTFVNANNILRPISQCRCRPCALRHQCESSARPSVGHPDSGWPEPPVPIRDIHSGCAVLLLKINSCRI